MFITYLRVHVSCFNSFVLLGSMNLCEARLLSNESLICKEQRKNEKGSWQDSLRMSIGNITSSDRTTSAKDSLQYCGKIDVSMDLYWPGVDLPPGTCFSSCCCSFG